LRQGSIGVPLGGILGGKIFLGALFVGVGPIEDLFFDELACGQGLEWCAGEVEIGFGRDREELDFLFRVSKSTLRNCPDEPRIARAFSDAGTIPEAATMNNPA
jgi:hypothetical protein